MKHLLILLTVAFLISCKKDSTNTIQENNYSLPSLTTDDVDWSTPTGGITVGGNISSDGGAQVTSRGICWSENSSPTIADNILEIGIGTGHFSDELYGLDNNGHYYMRSYATNSAGTAYGNEVDGYYNSYNPTISADLDSIYNITSTSATCACHAFSSLVMYEKGACCATHENPQPSDIYNSVSGSIGTYTITLIGLSPNTHYYARSYAFNPTGYAFSYNFTFTTKP